MLAVVAIAMLMVIACGSAEDVGSVAPTTVPAPTATQAPADTPEPPAAAEETPAPQPTVAPTEAPSGGPTATRPAPTEAPQPTSAPEPTAAPEPAPEPYPAVPGIVDPSNTGWPREVETLEGVVTLEAPPQRILTYSLGHDEMLIALVPPERVAALGKFASDTAYSNIANVAPDYPVFEKGAENVLAAEPDLFIVSAFTDADIVALVKDAGVSVVRPALESSAEGNIPNILLMGYILGVEDRALELAAEIESRLALISERVPPPDDAGRPAVISISRWSDSISVAGGGTSGTGIIESAGGVNAAARDGIDGFQTISTESIAAMNPDFIIIPQDDDGATTSARRPAERPGAGCSARDSQWRDPHCQRPQAHHPLPLERSGHRIDRRNSLFPHLFADVTFTDFEPYRGE